MLTLAADLHCLFSKELPYMYFFFVWHSHTTKKLCIYVKCYMYIIVKTYLRSITCSPHDEWGIGSVLFLPNKRPMGHIAHLRKQFKSIKTYDYIIMLIKRRKNNIIYFMRNFCFFIWRILNPPHQRMLCAKIGWNWLSGSGEENFLISICIFTIS